MDAKKIINEIKLRGLTAYKIAEDTGLTEVGINKILNGTSKTPRLSTITILHNYLFGISKEDDDLFEVEKGNDAKFKESSEIISKRDLRLANEKITYLEQHIDILNKNIKMLENQVSMFHNNSEHKRIEFLEKQNEFLTKVIIEKLNDLPVKEIKETHQLMTRNLLIEKLNEAKKSLNTEDADTSV